MTVESDPIRQFTDAAYDLADQRHRMDADKYAERKTKLVTLRRATMEVLSEDQRILFEEISLALFLHLLEVSQAEVSAIESQNGPSRGDGRLSPPH